MSDADPPVGMLEPPVEHPAESSEGLNRTALNVAVRLLAVALLAYLVPVAGLIALAGLVLMWLLRSRIDITSVLVLWALALWLVPSRYTVGAFAVTGAMAIGFFATLLWAFGRLLPNSRVAHGPVSTNKVIFFFFVVTLIGYLNVVLRPLASLDASSANRELAVMVGLCGIAVAITDGVRSRRQLNRMLGAIVAGAAIVAVIGFVQYFIHFDIARYLHPPGFKSTGQEAFIYHRTKFTRVAGTALHPIEFGLGLAASLPLALHFSSFGRTQLTRYSARLAAVLIAGAIPLSLSRSASLSLLLVALILLPTWTPLRRWRTLLTLLVLVMMLNILVPGVFGLIGRLFTGKSGAGSLQTRSDATTVGLNMIGNKPLFGNGFAIDAGTPVIIDNQYLVTGIEQGILGLVAMLTVIFGGIGAARRARRASTDPQTRDLAQSIVALIAAVALGGFGLNILLFPITAGLLFMGVGVAGALLRITSRTAIVTEYEARPRPVGASP
jgi:O-antigen ligase